MPTKLRNLKITRVDLVDQGANLDIESGDGAHVLLFKRAPMKAVPDDGGADGVTTDGRGEMPESQNKFDASELPEDAQAYISTLKAAVEKGSTGETESGLRAWLKDQFAGLKVQPEDMPEPDPVEPETNEEVLKGLDPKVQEFIAGVEKRATDAEGKAAEAVERAEAATKKADEIADARSLDKFNKRADDEFGFVKADDDTGRLLKAIADNLNEQDAEAVFTLLRGADEKVKQGGLFKEFGKSGSGDGLTANEEVQKRAEKLMADGEHPTIEQAWDAVLTQDPALATRANSEQA